MNFAWSVAGGNFTDDDGSLPGIEFAHLSPDSIRAVVDYFREHGTITSESATLHDNSRQADVPLNQVDDPAGLVVSGTVDSFHCCFSGLSYDGTEIPVLGLFVFPNCVEIDHRMGTEWNPDNVEAFFRLLAHLKSLAPEADVGSTKNEGLPYPERFDAALNHYAKSLFLDG